MPFICLGDDAEQYYAKGSNANGDGLIKEWICANLGIAFGLPVPTPEILFLPPELRDITKNEWKTDLQFDYLFALKSAEPCHVITVSDLRKIPPELKRDLLVFDAWIRNEDRNLTDTGGNPNLLIIDPSNELAVIDHNNAFDHDFNEKDVRSYHVFRDTLETHPIQIPERCDYAERFEKTLTEFESIISHIPSEWIESNSDNYAKLASFKEVLKGYEKDDFWGWLR